MVDAMTQTYKPDGVVVKRKVIVAEAKIQEMKLHAMPESERVPVEEVVK